MRRAESRYEAGMAKRDAWLIMLIPYFGKWPPWINLFMASCRTNPDVVWRFYTDCGAPENLPDNVEIVETSFTDYTAFAAARLGTPFAPTDPYKLCDLKPALGYVHESDIAGYEFYGFGDIDVIYGRISPFFPESMRRRFDILSTHSNTVSGHFCLFKNTRANRVMFRRIKRFGELLADPSSHSLDEAGLTAAIRSMRRAGTLLNPLRWVGLRHRPRKLFKEQFSTILSLRGWIDKTLNYPSVWRWRNGSLTTDLSGSREFLYLHFMRWKSLNYVNDPKQPEEGAWLKLNRLVNVEWRQAAVDGFSISAAGFGRLDRGADASRPNRAMLVSNG